MSGYTFVSVGTKTNLRIFLDFDHIPIVILNGKGREKTYVFIPAYECL